MIGKLKTLLLSLAVAACVLGGCYSPQDVTLHEAGVYKGSKDPLLGQHGQAEAKETLQQRFNLVQTDR
jgi:hypothetical protein